MERESEESPFGADGLVGVGEDLGEDAEDGRDRDGFGAEEAARMGVSWAGDTARSGDAPDELLEDGYAAGDNFGLLDVQAGDNAGLYECQVKLNV